VCNNSTSRSPPELVNAGQEPTLASPFWRARRGPKAARLPSPKLRALSTAAPLLRLNCGAKLSAIW